MRRSTRVRSQSTIDYPKKKQGGCTPKADKPKVAEGERKTTALPLSPRKRVGDDNACNLPPTMLGSPPKQSRKENSLLATPLSPRRPCKPILGENEPPAFILSPKKMVAGAPSPSRLQSPPRAPVGALSPIRSPPQLGSPWRDRPAGGQAGDRVPVVLSPRRNLSGLLSSLPGPSQAEFARGLLATPLSPVRLAPKSDLTEDNSFRLSPLKKGSPKQTLPGVLSPKRGVQEGQEKLGSPNRSPSYRQQQETPSRSPRVFEKDRKAPVIQLFKQEGSCYQKTKQALNTALPERLLSREKETEAIRTFITKHVGKKQTASLYISGAPGTGKTACLSRILHDFKDELNGVQCIFVNCMSLRSSQAVFPLVAEKLAVTAKSRPAGKDIGKKLEKLVTSPGAPVLLILDEMDQLDSKGQDILYTIFEWPWLENSRLCLIGIANALDLTDRILPRLQARPGCKPQLLNFAPYTRQQLAEIVQDRLTQVSGELVLDAMAIQFCARKVSAVSGDARKALDICRRAVEIVESDVRSQTVLKPPKSASPVKSPNMPKKVSLPHVSRVLSEVYGDRMAGGTNGSGAESFPLQQKLLICSMLLLMRRDKVKEVTLGKLHETYSKVCRKQQMVAAGQSECLSLCSLLESRGIFGLKKAKEARLNKITLKLEESDVEHALKDKVLMGSVLESGLL
ncbi:cell division control protein 6 homolog [Polypterus senegalus]|uniref:cell division control protein 6 homolog n=1 Tax=Polypterus senegalus TaxID=55291 RepID=UPI001962C9D1|nr:cell division control protein 6 homolog [Polypterus senegalus]XP_039596313.1 cell division control protein 6 homolog [Polypterus senegalus]